MLKNVISFNRFEVLNNLLLKRAAGHSKWANIRHIKGAKDTERSQIFTKLAKQIRLAVQEGGSVDPSRNLKLEQTLEQAKRVNMPAATIQNILKTAQSDKSNNKGHILEIKGPGSCIILCEVLTPHLHQCKQSISTVLKKHGGKYLDSSTKHMFDEKGIIEAESPLKDKTQDDILEMATEHAIESNAEEVKFVEENVLEFVCGKSNLKAVVSSLQSLNYNILSASVEFIALQGQELSEDELKVCEKLYEKLEALPEVIKISDNITNS